MLALCLSAAPSLRATVSFSGNTTPSAGTTTLGPFADSGGLFTVTASGFAILNLDLTNKFSVAELGQYSPGMGVCNTNEQTSCTAPEHAIDNNGSFDFILLTFNKPLTSIQLTLDRFGTSNDMDATYFVGNCASTCNPGLVTQANLSTLFSAGKFSGPINSAITPSTNQRTINLDFSGVTGGAVNWVLIGASDSASRDGNLDYFKLNSLVGTTGAPEPATFGLAGAALAAIGFLRIRKKRPVIS